MWEAAKSHWQTLRTADTACFDFDYVIDAKDVKSTVTWGTSPAQATEIDGYVPEEADVKALAYMDVTAGIKLSELDIGGCAQPRCRSLLNL